MRQLVRDNAGMHEALVISASELDRVQNASRRQVQWQQCSTDGRAEHMHAALFLQALAMRNGPHFSPRILHDVREVLLKEGGVHL